MRGRKRLSGWLMLAVMAMGVLLPGLAQTAHADDPAATKTGETTVEWYVDLDGLKQAATDAEPDDDGVKSAGAWGEVAVISAGTALEKQYALFTATVGEDGEVAVEVSETMTYGKYFANNLWILIAAFLVFIMHLGFAMVESGLTRAKNTVNILFKNTMIPMIGLVTYAICGWLIMYPGDWIVDGVFAFGFGIGGGEKGVFDMNSPAYNAGYTVWTDFIFQGMFAATCCTIVSGAVAGRVKLLPFLIFATIFVGICYPITGSWHWGGGWLSELGFEDFAGSTLVHAVGGAGALMGALILGPRLGKYAKDGSVQPIPGHSMPMVTIGVFLLWFGWFGFNGGSELSADPAGVSWVIVTTSLAACGGGLACGILSWVFGGKPDLTMALNGILAGLVSITACCHLMNWVEALIPVGMLGGALCYFAVLFFDKLKIDDPVGAISVHGVCGIYGTLCAGLWGASGLYGTSETAGGAQLVTQATGTFTIFIFSAIAAAILFLALKFTIGLRVSEAEEIEGLDLGEHDMSAYPDFQRTYIKSYHAREI